MLSTTRFKPTAILEANNYLVPKAMDAHYNIITTFFAEKGTQKMLLLINS
jgi:hypothetical protein